MDRCASRLLLFFLVFALACNSQQPKEDEPADSDTLETMLEENDSASAAEMFEDDEAIIAPAAEEAETVPYSFDTARVPASRSMDAEKWKQTVGTLDYSEKEMPKVKTRAREKSVPFDFTQLGKVLIVAGVLALLGILIWRLLATPPALPDDKEKFSILLGERHPDQMNADELEALLKKCLEEGNYRNAIRILYLMSLKFFTEKELIRWNREKTNRNYILELAGTSYQDNFTRLTLWYDSAWYGEHPISREQFEKVHALAGLIIDRAAKNTAG